MKRSELKSIIRSVIEESKLDYKVKHSSYTSAVQEMEAYAKRLGYELDQDQLATDIGMGPAKPKDGKWNKFHLTITKDGKELKKKLQVQIFGLGQDGYELNMYVN